MLDRLIGERYRQHRYQAGRREGHTEGREEGREVGREEGREVGAAEMHQLWEEWFERFRAAQTAGAPFTEPPPSLYSPNGKSGQTE